MSDATLRDQAVAQLQATTLTYPAWVAAGQPPDAWKNAFALLAQISYVAPLYGTALPARLAESTGSETVVTTLAALKTACAAGGRIRISGTITVGSEINLTLTKAGTAANPNIITGGKLVGRIIINAPYWRIRGVEITGSPYDGIKIAENANASFIDIDGCWIHHVGEQGIYTGAFTSSDIQVWNCLIEQCGQSYPSTSWNYNGIWTGGPTSRWTIGGNLIRPRNGFGINLYPSPAGVTSVANTIVGGLTRGGYAIRGATNVKVVGDIITGSPQGAFEITAATAAAVTVQDTIQYANVNGAWTTGYAAAATVANLQNVNPLLTTDGYLGAGSPAISLVQVSRHPFLPSKDRNGNLRTTADAGCYANGYTPPVTVPPPPPQPPAPVGTFGTGLPARMAATTGTVRNVTTLAGLKAAVALGGDIRITGTIDALSEPGDFVFLTAAGSAGSPNQISGGKILGSFKINSSYWRIKGVEITGGQYDGIKIADFATSWTGSRTVSHVEIDGCYIHDVGAQGVLNGYDISTDVQIWNCKIERVRLISEPGAPVAEGHCVYTGGNSSGWVIANCELHPKAFGVQLYPNPQNSIVTGCTIIGGTNRGGIVFGGADIAKVIGCVIVNSASAAFEHNSSNTAVTVQDCVSYNNAHGTWEPGYPVPTNANVVTGNPLLDAAYKPQAGSSAINLVQSARYSLLPAFDRLGNPRQTADAGCYAA